MGATACGIERTSRHFQAGGVVAQDPGLAATNAFVASAPLQQTRKLTYLLLHEMDEEERLLLENRNLEQLNANQILVATGALVALLLLALLITEWVVETSLRLEPCLGVQRLHTADRSQPFGA